MARPARRNSLREAGPAACGRAAKGAAHRRYLACGPPRGGPGRPQPYDGHGPGAALPRFAQGASGEEGMVLSTPGGNPGQCKRPGRVVRVVEPAPTRFARLLRPDIARAAARLWAYDKARFQRAWGVRAAPQCTGRHDWQARAASPWPGHVHASLRAVSCATLAARSTTGQPARPFARASLQRRSGPPHLLDRL
jgi:hypothetical protein